MRPNLTEISGRHFFLGLLYVAVLAVLSHLLAKAADEVYIILVLPALIIHIVLILKHNGGKGDFWAWILVLIAALVAFWVLEEYYAQSGLIRRYTPFKLY